MNANKTIATLGLSATLPYLQEVERVMANELQGSDSTITRPALRTLQASGKRLRPALVIAVVQCLGKRVDTTVVKAAAAVELLHIASLIHDDIIDNSTTRHTIATINALEGSDQALLVGDYLIATGLRLAIDAQPQAGSILASAFANVCVGQSQETATTFNLNRSTEGYLESIRKKSGALFGAACAMGGACAQATPQQISHLATYGEIFGTSFQIIDDLLDLFATSEQIGKPIGNDIKEGVYTLPVLHALAGSNKEKLTRLIRQSDTTAILQLLLADKAVEKTFAHIHTLNQKAAVIIKKCKVNNLANTLVNLPQQYQMMALGDNFPTL